MSQGKGGAPELGETIAPETGTPSAGVATSPEESPAQSPDGRPSADGTGIPRNGAIGADTPQTGRTRGNTEANGFFSAAAIPPPVPLTLPEAPSALSAPYECARKILTAPEGEGGKGDAAKALKCIGDAAPGNVEERYLQAVTLYRSGQALAAAPLLEGLAKDHPALADQCLWMAGKAYASKAMEKNALEDFLAVDGGSSLADDAVLAAAATMRRMGRLEDALAHLEPLAARQSRQWVHDMPAEAMFAKAEILEAQGHRKEAARTMLDIWTFHPRSPLAATALERAESMKVRPSALDQVIRAERLADANKNAAALDIVRPLLSKPPKGMDKEAECRARVVAGRALRKTRRYREAVDALRPVLEGCATGSESWAAGLYTLGTAASGIDSSLALDAFLRLEASMPESDLSDDALFLAAGILERQGDLEGARRLLRRVVLLHEEGDHRPEALFRLAWISRKTGALDDARDAFEQLEREYAVADSEASVRAMYWRARVLGEQGRERESTDLYRSLALSHSAGFYALLARTRLRLMEQAIRGETLPPSPSGSGQALATPEEAPPMVSPQASLELSGKAEDGGERTVSADAGQADNGVPKAADKGASGTGAILEGGRGYPPLRTRLLSADSRFLGAVELLSMGFVREAVQELQKVDRSRLRPPVPPDDLTALSVLLAMNGQARRAHVISRIELKQLFSASPDQGDMAAWQASWPRLYRDMIEKRATEAGIDPDLLQGLVREESAFEPTAGSWAGAMGLCQLMMPTAREVAGWLSIPGKITRDRLHDPDLNLRMGATYLSRLIRQFRGNTALAVAAYNAGAGSVRKFLARYPGDELDEFIEEIPFEETRFYVKRVLGSMATYQMLYGVDSAPVLACGLTIQR